MKAHLYFASLVAQLIISLALPAIGSCCTAVKLKAKDGGIVHGRTLEFGVKVDTSVVVIPRGYSFNGTTSRGPGLPYKSKYAVVGAMAGDHLSVLDGLNEKGLAVGVFYFPSFASYTPLTSENRSRALSPAEFSNWILTQFANIEEVKAGLEKIVIVPTIDKEWGSTPAPFHYIVYDRTGEALVIEPLQGKLVTHDNPLGTFTNSPTFDWHMTNLRNYINLTPYNVDPLKFMGLIFAPFGQGSGMVGLPGDFTPPSRFIRSALFSITAIPSENAEEGVYQLFHILNQFDIPIGIARQESGGVTYSDYTLVTCVREPRALRYYFKTYDDQSIKMVDLNAFDLNAKNVMKVSTKGKARAQDISGELKSL